MYITKVSLYFIDRNVELVEITYESLSNLNRLYTDYIHFYFESVALLHSFYLKSKLRFLVIFNRYIITQG